MGKELAQSIITDLSVAPQLVSSQPPMISHQECFVLRDGGLRIAHKHARAHTHTHTHTRARARAQRAYPKAKIELSQRRPDKAFALKAR